MPNKIIIIRNVKENSLGGLIRGTMISASLSPRHGASSDANGGTASNMEGSCEYFQ